ncbi:MAG: GNAT family N-acetyltransferase [Thiotrichales bacterium]
MNPPIQFHDFTENDIPLLQSYLNDPLVTQYLSASIPQPYTESDAQWWVSEGSHEGWVQAVTLEGQFVGTVGATPLRFERSRCAEIGYWVGREHWGKGLASVALAYLTGYLFETTDIVRLQAGVYTGNHASARVLEKCGYACEGVMKKTIYKNQQFYDAMIFARIKA